MNLPITDHQHTYDEQGNMICCSLEQRIYSNTEKVQSFNSSKTPHSHTTIENKSQFIKLFIPSIISFLLLITAVIFDKYYTPIWFKEWVRCFWYILSYLPVGFPVLKEAVMSIKNKEIFSEFLLMGIATIGAFAIGEFSEAVAVMLFYSVGEIFQTIAVSRAKSNIKSLLDQRPDEVLVMRDNKLHKTHAKNVNIGEIIQLKPGEKLALDGLLVSDKSSFNSSSLTGESNPDTKHQGDTVLAGMINLNTTSLIQTTSSYADSKLSKILDLIQNASKQKAPTELFIRKFARIYTPVVVILAILICLVPYLILQEYELSNWLYRALVFLVISCPCALVISIPLGYFGGIGAASKKGILFKGSNFLDTISEVQDVVLDKTGTMTEGIFKVQEIIFEQEFNQKEILKLTSVLESHSTHPAATAIIQYVGPLEENIIFDKVEEIPGFGLIGFKNGKELLVGNFKLLERFNISHPIDTLSISSTLVAIAFDKKFVGYILISDSIKVNAKETIQLLKKADVGVTMLSGDKSSIVKSIADSLGIISAFGDLLPIDKVNKLKELKNYNRIVAFVGDGFNDAPSLAMSNVGIAMGGLGSDVAIETADVVIQDDNPIKIPMAINIGKQTKRIVWQNIALAFTIKFIVILLGAGGIATMWEAVFADVGVALLAIVNSIRIQKMNF
ncbi:MAG: cadmium-translocating P-type ATPase [Saprospiraceae bacterium]|nr:cadmium-translocating P-type ATPase [Saprospiraceae bacterium]